MGEDSTGEQFISEGQKNWTLQDKGLMNDTELN